MKSGNEAMVHARSVSHECSLSKCTRIWSGPYVVLVLTSKPIAASIKAYLYNPLLSSSQCQPRPRPRSALTPCAGEPTACRKNDWTC